MAKIYKIGSQVGRINNKLIYRPSCFIRVRTNADNTPPIGYYDYYIQRDTRIFDVYRQSDDFSYIFWNDYKRNPTVVEVIDWNLVGVTDMTAALINCNNLIAVPWTDTSTVTNMHAMFEGCSSLTSVPLFDTSHVTSLGQFLMNTSVTEVPLFDTRSCTGFTQMFEGTPIIRCPAFDMSSATTTNAMFDYCHDLVEIPDFDLTNITNSEFMFQECYSLTDIPDLKLPNVNYCTCMFRSCRNIKTGILRMFNNLRHATTYHAGTFNNCGVDTVEGAAELALVPDAWKNEYP